MTRRSKATTHVLYDMDGLLLDTERFYTEAATIVCSRYGKTYDLAVKAQNMGRRALDAATRLITLLELPLTPEEYLEARQEILDGLFPGAAPMPGAVPLTRHLASHGIPQAVASSSDRRNFELKTGHLGDWFSLFCCFVLGDDPEVKHGKPDPDIFLVAARRMGADPESCLVFEDSVSGVEAAHRAGMQVVAVPDACADAALYHRADQVIASLEAFRPEDWGLPPDSSGENEDYSFRSE